MARHHHSHAPAPLHPDLHRGDPLLPPYFARGFVGQACISRCVRRAFLCGSDPLSGLNFDHRKTWLVEKLAALSEIFAVRICAYAVLSNHFHLVVRLDAARARSWSDDEVVERYGRLFPGAAKLWPDLPEARQRDRIACWQARLADLSWFMRCLNESIARRANQEDGCHGHFWEGRFRSQALLDEAGLLTCMTYVDLNPIRAGIAGSLEDSDFTSIQQRLAERAGTAITTGQEAGRPSARKRPALLGFAKDGAEEEPLTIDFESYVDLLAATGVVLQAGEGTPGLPDRTRRTLERVGVNREHWIEAVRDYRQRFFSMVGCVHRIEVYCARTDRDRAKGSRWAEQVFRNCA